MSEWNNNLNNKINIEDKFDVSINTWIDFICETIVDLNNIYYKIDAILKSFLSHMV